MDEAKRDLRILHLARQLAEVHIGDGDILGRMGRELYGLIDQKDPSIAGLPYDSSLPDPGSDVPWYEELKREGRV